MPSSIEVVKSEFGKLRKEFTFVTAAQHGATGRNAYASHIPEMKPHIVVSSTQTWHPNQPPFVFASEDYDPNRINGALEEPNNLKAIGAAVPVIMSFGKPVVIFDSWTSGSLAQTLGDAVGAEQIVTRSVYVDTIETKALFPMYLREAGCDTAKTPKNYGFVSTKVLPPY